MAVSINCSIKPPAPPNPSPPLHKPTMAPWSTSREGWWRSRCVSTAAAFVIIGSSAGFVGSDGAALAAGPIFVDGSKVTAVVKWSDQRKCPPWRVNSLENIVPENLPRPSASRRSHSLVAYGAGTAPVVGPFARYNSSCYSQ